MSRTDIAHLQHALDHAQGVGVEQIALKRRVQQFDQLFAVFQFRASAAPTGAPCQDGSCR